MCDSAEDYARNGKTHQVILPLTDRKRPPHSGACFLDGKRRCSGSPCPCMSPKHAKLKATSPLFYCYYNTPVATNQHQMVPMYTHTYQGLPPCTHSYCGRFTLKLYISMPWKLPLPVRLLILQRYLSSRPSQPSRKSPCAPLVLDSRTAPSPRSPRVILAK